MFNFFKKKPAGIQVADTVWMSTGAKFRAISAAAKEQPGILFVCWFEETYREIEAFFAKETTTPAPLQMTRELTAHTASERKLVFAEHYPLPDREKALYERLGIIKAEVWSGLDEPLFRHFGSEKIIHLMKQLGMKEEDAVIHQMITKSIRNAQEKISKKVIAEQTAHSQQDWMRKNLGT